VTLLIIDFEIIYRVGLKNLANILLRRPDYMRGLVVVQKLLLSLGEQDIDSLIKLDRAPDLLYIIV